MSGTQTQTHTHTTTRITRQQKPLEKIRSCAPFHVHTQGQDHPFFLAKSYKLLRCVPYMHAYIYDRLYSYFRGGTRRNACAGDHSAARAWKVYKKRPVVFRFFLERLEDETPRKCVCAVVHLAATTKSFCAIHCGHGGPMPTILLAGDTPSQCGRDMLLLCRHHSLSTQKKKKALVYIPLPHETHDGEGQSIKTHTQYRGVCRWSNNNTIIW